MIDMRERLILLFVFLTACSPTTYTRGIPNLARVDPTIYRSGQITSSEGWMYVLELAAGRKIHVIKLNYPNEGDDSLAVGFGMDVVSLPIQPEGDQDVFDDVLDTFAVPDEGAVTKAEAVLATCLASPQTDFCLVHCTHGQDRTGYVVGRYRVEQERWAKKQAFQEMRAHHFHWELVGLMVAWDRVKEPAR